jgi:hypothetical protein
MITSIGISLVPMAIKYKKASKGLLKNYCRNGQLHTYSAIRESKAELKGPKHEIFGSRVFTPPKHICVGDFRTERKKLFFARI